MGDRAIVVFHDDAANYSPAIYLHWHGGYVLAWVRATNTLMEGRPNDVDYTAARFVGIAHTAIPGNLSLGIHNLPGGKKTEKYWRLLSPGDRGVFLVNVNTHAITRYDGDE